MAKLNLKDVTLENIFNDAPMFDSSASEEPMPPAEESTEEITEEAEEQEEGEVIEQSAQTENEEGGEEDPEETEEEPELPVIDEIRQSFGFETDKAYEDDIGGIIELSRDYATSMAKNELGKIFEAYPSVKEFFDFRSNGGKAADYFALQNKAVDLSTLELKEDDVISQSKLIEMYFSAEGLEPEEIRAKIQKYSDAGILFDEADAAKKVLTRRVEKERTAMLKQQEEEQVAMKEAERQEMINISEVIKSGQTNGIVIPDTEKARFWEWMTKVDEDGMTQRMKERSAMDLESVVALEYLAYKGLDFSKLIHQRRQTKKTRNLRDRLAKSSTQSPVTRTSSGTSGHSRPHGTGKLPYSSSEILAALRGE